MNILLAQKLAFYNRDLPGETATSDAGLRHLKRRPQESAFDGLRQPFLDPEGGGRFPEDGAEACLSA